MRAHRHHHRRHHGPGLLGLAVGAASAAHTISRVARSIPPPRPVISYIPPPPPPPIAPIVGDPIISMPIVGGPMIADPIISMPIVGGPMIADPIISMPIAGPNIVDPIISMPIVGPNIVDPIISLPVSGRPMIVDPMLNSMPSTNPVNNYPGKAPFYPNNPPKPIIPGKEDMPISSGDLKENNINNDEDSVSSYSDDDNKFLSNNGIYGNPNLPPPIQPYPQMPPPPQNYEQSPQQNQQQMPQLNYNQPPSYNQDQTQMPPQNYNQYPSHNYPNQIPMAQNNAFQSQNSSIFDNQGEIGYNSNQNY